MCDLTDHNREDTAECDVPLGGFNYALMRASMVGAIGNAHAAADTHDEYVGR